MPLINHHQFVADFHESRIWERDVKWLGVPCQKLPLDLWIYQEIIFSKRPDVILETGTRFGGSALFLASICDLVGNGTVWSVDIIKDDNWPKHPRIRYLTGSSSDEAFVTERVKPLFEKINSGLVILDSDHCKDHVLREMNLLGSMLKSGDTMIVEDGFINGHPCWPEHGPGPLEAIEDFLNAHLEWTIDESKFKLLATFNPRGYLTRK